MGTFSGSSSARRRSAFLAALVGGGLIAYTRLARFEKNEANARTLFQAAQISLTRMDTAGELDAFCADVEDQGKAGTHFTDDVVITDAAGNEVRRRTASELNNGIYALYYDKTDGTGQNELVIAVFDTISSATWMRISAAQQTVCDYRAAPAAVPTVSGIGLAMTGGMVVLLAGGLRRRRR